MSDAQPPLTMKSDDGSIQREDLLRRFEDGWRCGQSPRIEDYLSADPARDAGLLIHLVHLETKHRIKANKVVTVSEYVARFPELASDPTFLTILEELVLIELECAWKAHRAGGAEPVRVEEYLVRFPILDDTAVLLRLVRQEYRLRLRAGETPHFGEYHERFPTIVAAEGLLTLVDERDHSLDIPGGLTSVARYRPLRSHAKGGLGEVLLAEDGELHRFVALKRIQEHRADDPDNRRRFLREAEITARLQHPGVVPVYGLTHDESGRPCYAMRFIEGESLQEAIQRFHAASPPQASADQDMQLRRLLGQFVQICNTVAYAHSRGIVHRDLKPANVMLGKFGETLVVDWGVARPIERSEADRAGGEEALTPASGAGGEATELGQAVGTPAYMSPEQATGAWDELGPASDIFSLGATLYAILTGQTPYKGRYVATVLEKAQLGDFPPPRQIKADVPRALDAVCMKAMSRKPDDRYASALALASDIERWLADEPISAERERWNERTRRWARRHRAPVAGLAAALVVGLISLAAATVLLTAANLEAKRQAARADKNLAAARKAVEDTLNAVADHPRLKEGDFHAVRRELLLKAVPFYEEFVAQKTDDPALEAERGRAYYRLGALRAEMGDGPEAVAAYRRTREVFASLVAEFPAAPGYRRELAASRNALGQALAGQGQTAEAEAEFRQAVAEQRALSDADPRVPEYRRDLAQTQTNLGNLMARLGRREDAEAAYRTALGLLTRLAHDGPDVPGQRLNLARNHNNLATLLAAQGPSAEVEQSYRQAVQILAALTAEFAANPTYRLELSRSQKNLGAILADQGKWPEAENTYRAALTVLEKLAADFPLVPAYHQELATSHNNLGLLLADQGKRPEAETAYRRALELRQRLAADQPDVPAYRQDLAHTQHNLGVLMNDLGRRDDAKAWYEKAMALRGRLAADYPAVPEYSLDLGATCCNLGELFRHGDPQAALGWFDRAEAALGPVVAADGRTATARGFLFNVHASRAEVREDLSRYTEALADWDLAVTLADERDRPGTRALRAVCLARAGRPALAVAEAAALAGLPESSAATLYDVARAYSVTSASTKDDTRLRDEFAARAVAVLRQAVAKGFKDVDQIRKDPDLAPLRGREDFAAMLWEWADMPAQKKP